MKAEIPARLAFGADIRLRCRIIPDEDEAKTRSHAPFKPQLCRPAPDFFLDGCGDLPAVDNRS
jgi:hypothetical protein